MNRREHSHRIVCTMQVTFSRNVIRQSLVRTTCPLRVMGSADSAAHVSLSSIFSCQRTDAANAMSWAMSLLALARQSVAHAALLDFTRANCLTASGAPPSLWGVYSRRPFRLSTAKKRFFEFFATLFPDARECPCGIGNVGLTAPSCKCADRPVHSIRASRNRAPLPPQTDRTPRDAVTPRGPVLRAGWECGVREGSRTDPAFVDFARRGRQLSRQRPGADQERWNHFSIGFAANQGTGRFRMSRRRLRRSM